MPPAIDRGLAYFGSKGHFFNGESLEPTFNLQRRGSLQDGLLDLGAARVGAALIVLALLISFAPETVVILEERPTWRPQRVAVSSEGRRQFFAATAAGIASFAVYGVFNSLVPSFLAGTLHKTSQFVAGAVVFSAFAAGTLAQIVLGRLDTMTTLRRSVPILLSGLALFNIGMWCRGCSSSSLAV